MAWHESNYGTLDLLWDDGRPGCSRCKRWAPKITPKQATPPAPPPNFTPRSQLRCTWPPQVQYTSTLEPDLKKLEREIRDNIDTWDIGSMVSDQYADEPQIPVSTESDPIGLGLNSNNIEHTIYEELQGEDAIRLLRLHGSNSLDAPIHCSLEHASLGDPCVPTFEAVCYTWSDLSGDAMLCEPIYVGPNYDRLSVTKNCAAALRRIRVTADRLLWIDAICINQIDLSERDRQVSMMGDIYRSASRVIAYLGEWPEHG